MATVPALSGCNALSSDPYNRGFLHGLEDGYVEAQEAMGALLQAIEHASGAEGMGRLEAAHLTVLVGLCGDGFKHRAEEARQMLRGSMPLAI